MSYLKFNKNILENKIFQRPIPPIRFKEVLISKFKVSKVHHIYYNAVALELVHNNLNKVIQENINLVNKLDGTININLINHLSKEVILNFDYEQFNRVFFNLIKNSLESIQEKAKKANKINKKINIELKQRRDYINVNLIDTGIGFKDKQAKDLIRPYYTTKQKGTGLGLSIVDKIISDHNGSIKFLNHKNGAKIQIIIPIK